MLSVAILPITITHLSLETPKMVTGKQGRPRSDATECGVR